MVRTKQPSWTSFQKLQLGPAARFWNSRDITRAGAGAKIWGNGWPYVSSKTRCHHISWENQIAFSQFFLKTLQLYFCCCFAVSLSLRSEGGKLWYFCCFRHPWVRHSGCILEIVLRRPLVNFMSSGEMRQQRFEAAESLKFTLSVLHLVKSKWSGHGWWAFSAAEADSQNPNGFVLTAGCCNVGRLDALLFCWHHAYATWQLTLRAEVFECSGLRS